MDKGIIDFHIHFAGEDVMYQDEDDGQQYDYSIDLILQEMDESGTEYALISSLEPMMRTSWLSSNRPGGLLHGGNEKVAEAVARSKGRLLGAFVPNPYKEAGEIRDEIKLFVETYDFRAIKLHPWLGSYPANAWELIPVFEAASELRLPVLYHSGTIPFTTPAEMFDMAKRFPEVPVVMGHAGGTELWYDVMALAEHADNLLIETSGQPNRIFIQEFAFRFGAKRILYGSDWLGQPGKMLFRKLEMEEVDLSPSDKEDIFRRNAWKMLKLTS